MARRIASQLGADLSPLRGLGIYDFRDRNDGMSAHLSESVNIRSLYQMYSSHRG
jgi:hypothetical protein